jgi:predicted nucleic acid-binding protein
VAATLTNEATRRLAQYRPFDRGGQSLREVLQDLVLAAAVLDGGGFGSLAACREGFRTLWGLQVEIHELRAVGEELVRAGLAEAGHPGITLTAETVAAMEERSAASAATEEQALVDWEADVRSLRPDVTSEDFDCLREDLAAWLQQIITRHGAEAALMLYPEEPRAHRLFDEIDALGTGFLPAREGCAGEVRDEALRLFVRKPGPAQRQFLANRLNTAFYLTVLTLDPAARKLAQESLEGRRLYLDTNFLYAVLGAAPAREVHAAHRLLELTKGLGYQLAVTPWTVHELHESIKRARQGVEQLAINPQIAELMVQVSGEKGYSLDFWRTFREFGTTPQDYFERVAHFEYEFPRLGIEVVDESCAKIDAQEELVEDYAALLDRMLSYPRHEDVLRHDAKHRLLVERLRGDGNIRFSNAHCWFVTQDTYLPRFAERMPDPDDAAPELPFCITPSAWLQVMRALTPRTEDYEQTIVDLLASPFVGYQRPADQKAVREVVGRLEDQKDRSPELALAVLQDTALVHEITVARGPQRVAEEVERAYSTKTRELQEQAAAAATRASEEQARREQAEQRAREIERDRDDERGRREGLEADLRREQEARTREQADLRQAIETAKQESQDAIDEERRRREQLETRITEATRRRRVLSAAGAAVVATIAAILVLALGVVTGTWGTVAVITGALTVISLAARISLGEKWGAEVLGWVGAIAGIIGTVVAIVLALAQK